MQICCLLPCLQFGWAGHEIFLAVVAQTFRLFHSSHEDHGTNWKPIPAKTLCISERSHIKKRHNAITSTILKSGRAGKAGALFFC